MTTMSGTTLLMLERGNRFLDGPTSAPVKYSGKDAQRPLPDLQVLQHILRREGQRK